VAIMQETSFYHRPSCLISPLQEYFETSILANKIKYSNLATSNHQQDIKIIQIVHT